MTTPFAVAIGTKSAVHDGEASRRLRRETRWLTGDLLVSLSLVALVIASATTLPRLFVETRYTQPILIAGITGSGFALFARYARLPFFVAPILSGPITLLYAARFCLPDVVTSLNPLSLPLRAVGSAIRLDWSELSATKAPVLGRPGFALSAILGVWLISALSDMLAFSLRSPIEAIVPPAVLVLVGSIVAPPSGRIAAATVFGAAAVFHAAVSTAVSSRRTRWADGLAPSIAPQLVPVVAATVLAALVTAVAIPRSGLADREGVVDLRTANGRSLPSTVTSPMVSLKRQLLDLPDTVMFTATSNDADGSPTRTYWRLSTLRKFNGTTWTSSSTYRPFDTSSALPPGPNRAAATQSQSVVIEGLRSAWLPLAYQARSFDAVSLDATAALGYDARGGAVLMAPLTGRGVSYRQTSVSATPETAVAGQLFDAGWNNDDLALPNSFPSSVADVAKRIAASADAAGAGDATAIALRRLQTLQQFFRTQFTYSTNVPPPSSQNDLETFVLTDRAGYCEQFSGAFAAMARSLGIPARVAVGFSPGRLGADGRFVVTGKNSHAWPEAYIEGLGWLPFEPTPGRGIPGAESYTGVADQDASEGLIVDTAPVVAPTIPRVPTIGGPTPSSVAPAPEQETASRSTSARFLAIAFGAALVAIGLATAMVLRRSRRRDRVEAQWRRIERRLQRQGLVRVPHETERSLAQRSETVLGHDTAATLRRLAERVEEHRYGPTGEWTEADTEAFTAEAQRFRQAMPTGRSRSASIGS
jgi:transglutaminase-like putative cysteine protease